MQRVNEGLAELERQVSELREAKRWSEALAVARLCADQYHVDERGGVKLHEIMSNITLTQEEFRSLRQEAKAGVASSCYFVGYCYELGVGGVPQKAQRARRYYGMAAELGHHLAQCCLGSMLYYSFSPSVRDTSVPHFLASAEGGCPEAMSKLGDCYASGVGLPQDWLLAALWYSRGVSAGETWRDLAIALRRQPMECAPWGVWRPDIVYHRITPRRVRAAIKEFLLVARCRLGLLRDLVLMICAFIVTRDGWDLANLAQK
jgi:hypothetical protein